MIIEDVGEQVRAKHYVGKVLKKKGIEFKREEIRFGLERVGDYIGREENDVYWMVERKRYGDFLNSCKDGSYEKQLEKMVNYFHGIKYVIFEGNWDQLVRENWPMRGLLWSRRLKTAKYGISFVVCKDEKETATFLFLLEKYGKKIANSVLETKPHKPKLVKAYDHRLRNLITVPGIGQKTAKTLLDKFNSIDYIIELAKNNPQKLTAVKGIGKKTVERIKEMYTSKEKILYGNNKHQKSKGRNVYRTSKVHGRSNPKMVNNASIHGWGQNNGNPTNYR